MSTQLKKILYFQVLLFFHQMFFSFCCFGQACSTTPQLNCTPVNAQGGVCNSQTIFCIGDSVGFINQTTSNIDSSFICWGDGIVQGIAGMATPICRKHLYNFPVDSCVGGNGQNPSKTHGMASSLTPVPA